MFCAGYVITRFDLYEFFSYYHQYKGFTNECFTTFFTSIDENHSPHSVFLSLAIVPGLQGSQTEDPGVLTVFRRHLVQVCIPKPLYVPAGQTTEIFPVL